MLVNICGPMTVVLLFVAGESDLAVLRFAVFTLGDGVRCIEGILNRPVRSPVGKGEGIVSQWSKDLAFNRSTSVYWNMHVDRPECDAFLIEVEDLCHHASHLLESEATEWIGRHDEQGLIDWMRRVKMWLVVWGWLEIVVYRGRKF
jgi:hypothetical protein